MSLDVKNWGLMAGMLKKYAEIVGEDNFIPPKAVSVIACADHGVAQMGVSAYPAQTTREMAANYLISRGAAANAAANFAAAEIFVVDVGIAADTEDLPSLHRKKIAWGTKNITEEAAMSRAEAEQSVTDGILIATELYRQGYRVFLPGEMGIGNTTAAAAICSVLCGLPPEEVTGYGTGISEAQKQKKAELVRRAIDVNKPNPQDALDVLTKVGGFEFGFMAGLMLGAATKGALVILDGFNTGVAALIAHTLAPPVTDYLMASQLAGEPGHKAILERLNLSPVLSLNLKLSEGVGSSLAFFILTAAIELYHCDDMDDASTPEHDGEVLMQKMFAAITEDSHRFIMRRMNHKHKPVTDRTFDFYYNTMPTPDRVSMQACRRRLDHLAKPVDSLGALEEIAVELAGIIQEDRPELGQQFALLCIGSPNAPEPDDYLLTLGDRIKGDIVFARLTKEGASLTSYFDFGRYTAEDISFDLPLVGIALITENPARTEQMLQEALLNDDGTLRYAGDEFLAHVPEELQREAAAALGAIIAAAHNSSLVIIDSSAELIARYTAELLPAVKPYLMYTSGKLLHLESLPPGFYACFGKKIVDASMHILNDMKTFAETSVTPAKAGNGVTRQG